MEYKVGDKVRVVALEGFQDGSVKIGDIVTIIKKHPNGKPPHYSIETENGKIWWLHDNEIELYEEPKMPKYTTEPIDYANCHPVIAEHLKRGEAILCRVRDSSEAAWKDGFMVSGYRNRGVTQLRYTGWFVDGKCNSFCYAEPIPAKRKVLMSAEKAVVKLIENGWKLSEDGKRLKSDIQEVSTLYLKRNEGLETTAFLHNYLFEEVEE